MIKFLEVIVLILPILLSVAFVTISERKTMAYMQRRQGPNSVGYYGLLQAYADALKLLIKEYVTPSQSNNVLFFIGPIITIFFSLAGYAVIPYMAGLTIYDFNLGILYILAMSSLSTYGILLAGWSANSKYAFLGCLRSTAQLISYELILSSAILLIIILTGSLNVTTIIEYQKSILFIYPLLPIFIMFLIASVAETNRAPFDLAEAESELVSGFMTEHAAVIFVFFFLAEYASIVLICILLSILFFGGYMYNIIDIILFIEYYFDLEEAFDIYFYNDVSYFSFEGWLSGMVLSIKSFFAVFVFIWIRASFPRIRFDQLMVFCWTVLLPLVISFIILIPCLIYSTDTFTTNITVL